MRKFDLSYLENSEIYEVNRLESKSDHKFYQNDLLGNHLDH